jgi:hypothetical protein
VTVAALSREQALDAVAALDLDAPKARICASGWPRYLANEIELEYRRFLVLVALNPAADIRPPPLVDTFRRQHAADEPAFRRDLDGISAGLAQRILEQSVATVADGETLVLYGTTFPDWDPTYWRARSVEEIHHALAKRHAQR